MNTCQEMQTGLYSALDQPRYCSSLTFSIQSAVLPSSCSTMAMCVMAVVAVEHTALKKANQFAGKQS